MSTIKRIRKGKTLNISFTVTTNGVGAVSPLGMFMYLVLRKSNEVWSVNEKSSLIDSLSQEVTDNDSTLIASTALTYKLLKRIEALETKVGL